MLHIFLALAQGLLGEKCALLPFLGEGSGHLLLEVSPEFPKVLFELLFILLLSNGDHIGEGFELFGQHIKLVVEDGDKCLNALFELIRP